MNHRWSRLGRTRWALAVTTMILLTACSGPPQSTGPAPAAGGMAESAGAPEPPQGPPQDLTLKRDVVRTASMTIDVANTSEAADKAAVVVERANGRVDSRPRTPALRSGRAHTSIVLRVPAAKLDGVVRELKALGTVQTADTTAEDVTAQRVDLDARITALQTSVDRLLAIMRDAKDPDALIKAEDALSQRQADLDSLRAQRDQLGDRVDYSTVSVTFYAEEPGGPAPREYVGFLGQVERGWDGLVSTVGNGMLLFGLLLPWLAVVVVLGAASYLLIRVVRRTR